MGVPEHAARLVDQMIDQPEKCREFVTFVERECPIYAKGRRTRVSGMEFIRHDGARRSPITRKIQLEFVREKGSAYVKAFYLHQMLDYVAWWVNEWKHTMPSLEEILRPERMEKKVGDPQDPLLQEARQLLIKYSEAMFRDCRR